MTRRGLERRSLPRRVSRQPVGPGRGVLRAKTAGEIEAMAAAGELVVDVHERLVSLLVAGVSTGELDAAAAEVIRQAGAVSSFLGHQGFPRSICTSVNEEIVHGIPSERRLTAGDVISIDVGVILDRYHGDAAWTYPVGSVSRDVQRLLDGTEDALNAAVAVAMAGQPLSTIGRAVEAAAAAHQLGVVDDYGGHGIGQTMWEEPHVPNIAARAGPIDLFPGLTLAVEPMLSLGNPAYLVEGDGWTIRTVDGSFAAHFEHDLVVMPDGEPRVFTAGLANVLH